MKMSVVENVYCSHLECANVVCDKNLKILAPVAIGDEIIIKDFGKACLDHIKEDVNEGRAVDLTQALKNAVNSIYDLTKED